MHRFIAELLHPNVKMSSSYFPASQIFWDRLVKLASSQLILPAIYGALKRKKLINNAPKDFISYLQEISILNQKRNAAILKQIDFLSEVFNRNQIDYAFLKGAAILITEPYEAKIERMVGDIDILVSEKDITKAQQLLTNEGYDAVSSVFSFTKGVLSNNHHRHLERISHPDYIAAVEIHRRLLNKNHLLSSKDVLENKLQYKKKYYIPSKQHLWQHAILNWQYNDSGIIRNALDFRTVVDVLYLESKNDSISLKNTSFAIKHFYSLLSLYYNTYFTYYPFSKLRYKWQLTYKLYNKLNNLYFRLNYLLKIILQISKSKAYIKRVFNNPKIVKERILNFWNK